MNHKMSGLNLELTTCCPLHCPQCYCTLTGGKHLPLELAKKRLDEAAAHGVSFVNLSGGETLCYPWLYEVVAHAASVGIAPNVALCGYRFDGQVLDRLIEAGVHDINISLNGSTRELNTLTRDGYELALDALALLRDRSFPNTWLNWVMHSNNCGDFMNMVHLAEEYHVSNLLVLAFKPDARNELKSFPSAAQIRTLAEQIRGYRGSVRLRVESCFSQLRAVLMQTPLFGNLNVGPGKGCRAGLYNYSINVDGQYAPCRHLDIVEDWPSLDEYLEQSPVIARLRAVDQSPKEPCSGCQFGEYCRHCLAVNYKIHGDIFLGNSFCELHKSSLV